MEYDERWTMEYFVVDDKDMKEGLPFYVLKDTMGDVVEGTFYGSELSKVTVSDDTVNRVEKFLRKKRDQVLVKWMGWSAKFNSWLPLSSLEDYKRSTT